MISSSTALLIAIITAVVLSLSAVVFWPSIDLTVSQFFYTAGQGFVLAVDPFFMFLHNFAFYGARLLAGILFLGLVASAMRRRTILGLGRLQWLFLLLALLLGPALVANAVLKDNWGRARPREVTEFGGTYNFSSALEPQPNPRHNGSFVAGDPAFGFYLTSFAYVVPVKNSGQRSRKKIVFWSGMAMGAVFGFARIAMGGHFLSDVLFSSFFMLAVCTLLHIVMFGRKDTATNWRDWLFLPVKDAVRRG